MKTKQILLVEDNEGDILLLKDAFEESNFLNKISVIRDGKEAIDFFKNSQKLSALPDLILLDINLPKKNGHEILKQIKSSGFTKDIPVIILTTSSSEKEKFQCYQIGVDHFMTKPVEVQDFTKTVKSVEYFFENQRIK